MTIARASIASRRAKQQVNKSTATGGCSTLFSSLSTSSGSNGRISQFYSGKPRVSTIASGRSSGQKWLLAQLHEHNNRIYFPNPFASISELWQRLGTTPPSWLIWRLTNYKLGMVNGIPNSRGRLVATDGVMCVILQDNIDKNEDVNYFLGHISAWVDEEKFQVDTINNDNNNSPASNSTKPRKPRKVSTGIELLAGLTL